MVLAPAEPDQLQGLTRGRRAIRLAQLIRHQLGTPGGMRDAAQRVLDTARDFDCHTLIGASASGDQIVGAAIAIAEGEVQVWNASEPGARVLIVDATVASGIQMERVVRRVEVFGTEPYGFALASACSLERHRLRALVVDRQLAT